MSLPSEDFYCRHFQPNTFDPSRCSACLRPGHMHLDTAPTDASQERELGDDEQILSEVNSSASSNDIRDNWTYEWSLGRSLSPECELDICDTDTQSSSENNPESPQRSNSLNSERYCVTLGDMTRMDPSPLRGAGSPWMDERRGRNRSRRTSESRGVREQESGYFSPEQRTDGEHLAEDANKRSYRYYERGHPLPNNYVPEPKASVPYRNVNLGIPSQRRNPETYMQDTWRSESPQRYSYHSNFRRGTESLRNSPTRHSSISPERHKRSDPRMRSLSRSETQSHGSSNLPSRATSQRTSSRSSPSRRRGSFASRSVSPSRLTPSHKHTESFFSQNGGYEAQGGCSREPKIPSRASNKHSLDSERLYRNLESISRRASPSSTFQQNTNEGSQRSPRTREGSPSRNGSHSRISQRQPSSRDSRASASPGSWQGSSQSVRSIPISCGSSASRHGADHQGPGASPPLVAITETDNFSAGNTKISGDRSRSSVRRGMEALLLSEPKRAAQELEEVGMTMEDYIVLADIPTIHVESEDDYPGIRRRNQSPSPCRDQRFRTQSHQPQAEFYSWNSASDERGRGRERVRDRREKDSDNGRLSQRQSKASLRTQSSDRQSGEQRSAKMTERRLPGGPQTKMPATLKGWMSRLDENDMWRKHWFVLDDASLKYYRDPEAEEESDDLDGEIDLSTCVNVSDWDVEKNFGLRIQTKRAVYTLSAVTSTLRRNWVTLLKQAIQNNTHQSESGGEKENPLSLGPSSCQPVARFTCSGFEPAGSNSTAEGLHPPTDVDVHEEVSSDPQRKEEQEEGWDRDWAKRLEERNKWFEDAVPFSEVGRRWDCMQLKRGSVPVPVIDTMDSEVSRKWTEFERLSFKDMSAQSLIGVQAYQTITWLASESPVDTQTCQSRTDKDEAFVTSSPTDCWRKAPATLNGSHTVQTNTAEALPKEARKQMESTKRDYAAMVIKVDSPCGPGSPCGAQLEAMEAAHRKEVQELQEQHERQLSELEGQRDKMLEEERQASAKVLEALKAAHREELEKARRIPGGDAHMEAPCGGHVLPVDVWHSELDVLSERFSEKCLQLSLTQQSGQRRENDLDCKERELQQLWRENQELKVKLAEEISRMRYFITGQRPDVLSLGNVASDVETLLRAKENEVHSLKRQVSCLQSEVQSLTKEKEAAYERYKESYVELSDLKCRNRLEMDSLNEHLTLVDAARQERARESCEQ